MSFDSQLQNNGRKFPSAEPKLPDLVNEPTSSDGDSQDKTMSRTDIDTTVVNNVANDLDIADAIMKEEPALELPPKVYDFSKAICMKTSDRILDDLRSDPLFLLRGNDGILSLPTIAYSKALSQIATSTSTRYQPVFWNTNNLKMGSYQINELENNQTLANFTGLLVPSAPSGSEFVNTKIFHYSIKIKYSNDRINLKNTFYGFYDDQIFEDDKLKIEPDDILGENDSISKKSIDILLKSLPQVSDSANFISKETGTIIRLEIYPAILSSTDLETFDLTEIQTRIVTYNSENSHNCFENVNLTPYDCFLKFKSALTGALKQPVDKEPKSIDLNTTKLRVIVDIQLLLDKFFFTLTHDSTHLSPVQLSTLGDYGFVYEEFFKRAITEIVYFTALTSANINDLNNLFSDSFNDVFKTISDFDVEQQIKNWNNRNDQYYLEPLILLSICPFYNDQLISHIYDIISRIDPVNLPLYFDAFTYCATSRYSEELPYRIAILQDEGMLGFGELKSFFAKFGFGELTQCEEMNQISDEQLLLSYKNQIIVATSKYEQTTFRNMLLKIAKYRSSNLLTEYLNTEPYFDIIDAYALLDVDPSLDDSLLITFYDYKVGENSNYDANIARAFFTIGLARKSVVLMNYIQNNLPQFLIGDISFTDACKVIGCTETTDDLLVIRIFQERLNKDTGVDFRMLWKSLKTIGQYKHSKLIVGYLSSGTVNSKLLSVDQSPAGLNNIGNTCYLNSLLQYYFVIEPLRDYILNFNEVFNAEEFNHDENYKKRRIGGRTVNMKETERSYQFMYQLRDLYYQLIHENDKCVTPSRELAYLAFSPISFEVEFKDSVENEDEEFNVIDINSDNKSKEQICLDDSESNNILPITSRADDHEMIDAKSAVPEIGDHEMIDAKSDVPEIGDIEASTSDEADSDSIVITGSKEIERPKVLINNKERKTAAICKISADQFECAFDIGSQQDVTECISNVLIQIESAMKPEQLDEENEQCDMIKKLFYGKTKQRLAPVDRETKEEISNGNVRSKVESFLNLIVNIGDHPKDIYDALDTFFTEDLLELDDGEVKRSLTIIDLPNILQIQIQRVQFDRERLIPIKSNELIPFEEKLYMDRYLESEDEILINKRKEIFYWRRRVEELNKRKGIIMKPNQHGMTSREAMKITRDYLESNVMKDLGIPIDMNTLEVLDLEIERLDNELTAINNELEQLQHNISKQFEGFNKVGYSIFAIFIHRGQASYGHYFIYIRDPKSNVFRKYNDEEVSEVPIEEVFNFNDGNTATPYYLTFIKEELLDKITPLHRDILVNQSLEKLNDYQECDMDTVTTALNADVD